MPRTSACARWRCATYACSERCESSVTRVSVARVLRADRLLSAEVLQLQTMSWDDALKERLRILDLSNSHGRIVEERQIGVCGGQCHRITKQGERRLHMRSFVQLCAARLLLRQRKQGEGELGGNLPMRCPLDAVMRATMIFAQVRNHRNVFQAGLHLVHTAVWTCHLLYVCRKQSALDLNSEHGTFHFPVGRREVACEIVRRSAIAPRHEIMRPTSLSRHAVFNSRDAGVLLFVENNISNCISFFKNNVSSISIKIFVSILIFLVLSKFEGRSLHTSLEQRKLAECEVTH